MILVVVTSITTKWKRISNRKAVSVFYVRCSMFCLWSCLRLLISVSYTHCYSGKFGTRNFSSKKPISTGPVYLDLLEFSESRERFLTPVYSNFTNWTLHTASRREGNKQQEETLKDQVVIVRPTCQGARRIRSARACHRQVPSAKVWLSLNIFWMFSVK